MKWCGGRMGHHGRSLHIFVFLGFRSLTVASLRNPSKSSDLFSNSFADFSPFEMVMQGVKICCLAASITTSGLSRRQGAAASSFSGSRWNTCEHHLAICLGDGNTWDGLIRTAGHQRILERHSAPPVSVSKIGLLLHSWVSGVMTHMVWWGGGSWEAWLQHVRSLECQTQCEACEIG